MSDELAPSLVQPPDMFRGWTFIFQPAWDFHTGQQSEGIAITVMAMKLLWSDRKRRACHDSLVVFIADDELGR